MRRLEEPDANSRRKRKEELLYVIHAAGEEESSSSYDNLSYEEEEEEELEGAEPHEEEVAVRKSAVEPREAPLTKLLVQGSGAMDSYDKKSSYVVNGGRQLQQQQQQQQQQLRSHPQQLHTVSFKSPRQRSYYFDRERSSSTSFASSSSSSSSSSACCCCPSAYDDEFGGQSAYRVVLVAICLCVVHTAGLLVATYLLINKLLEPDLPEKAINHICTTAVFCPFYYVFEGLTAIAVQLSGSVCGLTLSLLLLLGGLHRLAWPLVVWLVSYSFAICGCVILFGVMLRRLMLRQEGEGDVHWSTMALCAVPLLLAVLYTLCWAAVVALWRRIKREDNRPFTCVE